MPTTDICVPPPIRRAAQPESVPAMPEATRSRWQQCRDYLAMERIPGAVWELDGLRGIAVLLVLLRHGTRPFARGADPWLNLGGWNALSPLLNGWMGVDLFFVLSGFLISAHILQRWPAAPHGAALRRYVSKRLLRIVPAYYAVLLIVAAGWLPFHPVDPAHLAQRVAYHLLFLQDYFDSNIVVAFWSLGVEEKFYLLAPVLVVPLMRRPRWRMYGGVLLALFVLPLLLRVSTYLGSSGLDDYARCFPVLRSPFHVSVDSLIAGTACAFLVRFHARAAWLRNARAMRWMFGLGTLTVAALLLTEPLLDEVSWFDATALFSVIAIAFAAVLLSLVLHQGPWSGFFRAPWLFFFSKISYSLYLVHMLFTESTYRWLNGAVGLWTLPLGLQLLVYLPVYAGVSILAALLLHYAVEKPFLIVKDRL